MQKLSLCDELLLTVTNKHSRVDFSCDDSQLPTDETNLVVQAVRAFQKASKRLGKLGVELSLKKRIPVAAGLGGGSSDAGAVLRGLNKVCGDEFDEKELVDIALPLGADVPFFVVAMAAAYAEGIGEKLYPAEAVKEYVFLLVNPGFAVSTREIFQNLSLTSTRQQSILTRPLREDRQEFTLDQLHNDLEKVTCSMYPQLNKLKKKLVSLGALDALMSGSGPTVFGVFGQGKTEEELYHICRQLGDEYGEKIFVVRAM